KVQCGGPRGLQQILSRQAAVIESNQQSPDPVDDIAALLDQAEQQYQDLSKLPYSKIVRFISHHPIKKRSRRK
ncbi:hypothetical protein, partial [Candidatus Venteria ishoeyi]